MATVPAEQVERPLLVPIPRLLTAADLAALPDELPSGPVKYELDNGRLVTMAPAGEPHAASQADIIAELKFQGERRGLGKAYGEIGVILWKNPFRVVEPDAAFVRKESLPIRTSPERYLETIPDLVVEVRSKNDTKPYLARKVADYLEAGVKLAVVVEPDEATVTLHRKSLEPTVLKGDDVFTCDDIIEGFALPLRQIFHG